jgi:hypothetical protein
MKLAESFPSPGDEKITKGLAHCEERPSPYVTTDEKCAIFSNSVVGAGLQPVAVPRSNFLRSHSRSRRIYSADCHNGNHHTAASQETNFDIGLPQA